MLRTKCIDGFPLISELGFTDRGRVPLSVEEVGRVFCDLRKRKCRAKVPTIFMHFSKYGLEYPFYSARRRRNALVDSRSVIVRITGCSARVMVLANNRPKL